MPTLHEFLNAQRLENSDWRFSVPAELHGAFGGAFGGVVSSCALVAARSAAPGRTPNALDIRFLRGLRAGDAIAHVTTLHAGRSLTNLAVELRGADDKLCAHATISLVDPDVLHEHNATSIPGMWTAHADAAAWPPVAPIVSVIDPRMVGSEGGRFATSIAVPWDDDGHSAEASCMAGDMAVGMPLGAGTPEGVGTPNPDLSLRFCGEVDTPTIVGVGRLRAAAGGIAAVDIEVWSDSALVAIGVSTALLLPPP